MHKTFYEILGVDKAASPELLAEAYKLSLRKCEEGLNSGDLSRQNELVLIKEAYRTLSDLEKRKVYDAALPSMAASHPPTAQPGIFLPWWATSKTSLLLAGIFLLFVAYLGLGYYQAAGSRDAASETVSVEAVRAANEARLVDGVIRNEEQALDRRANAETQRIELQRREQEARLELERERERMRQEQLDKQLEAQQLERERRYYSCLNGAIDRVGVAEASAYCSRFR